jgi:hypothetical protein
LTEVKGRDGGPLSGTLLASGVNNEINNVLSSLIILLTEDVGSDLNEEGVKVALVPLVKDDSKLVVAQTKEVLEQLVSLSDELHISVLNTVVNHLNEVPSTLLTDPVTAWYAIVHLSGNGLEDRLNMGPGIGVTTGHDRRTPKGTLLTSRDTSADKEDSLGLKVVNTAVGVWVVGVTTVDDDVALKRRSTKK